MFKVFTYLLISILFLGASCNQKNVFVKKKSLNGYFTTIGNAPFQETIFRTKSGEIYYLLPELKKEIKFQKGKKIKIDLEYKIITLETVDKKIRKNRKYIKKISKISDADK